MKEKPSEKAARRERDLKMLNTLLNLHSFELRENEVEAFADMRYELTVYPATSGYFELTRKQREWVESAYARVNQEAENLVSRGLVPRGREVEPAEVLKNLPTKPPGRKVDE